MKADKSNKATMHARTIYFFFYLFHSFSPNILHFIRVILITVIGLFISVRTHARARSLAVGLLDAVAKGLLNDEFISGSRVLVINITNGALISSVWWSKSIGGLGEPTRVDEDGIRIGFEPSEDYPWYVDEMTSPGLRSPKCMAIPENTSFRACWSYPYYSCTQLSWILSYIIAIPPLNKHG